MTIFEKIRSFVDNKNKTDELWTYTPKYFYAPIYEIGNYNSVAWIGPNNINGNIIPDPNITYPISTTRITFAYGAPLPDASDADHTLLPNN